MQKITATLFAGILAAAAVAAADDKNLTLTEDMAAYSPSCSSLNPCFTIETIRNDQTSNPWCVDAFSCGGGADCIGDTIGLRLCDPITYPTQLFSLIEGSSYIYLAFYLGLCFQVNFSNSLVVSFCDDLRRRLQKGLARFDFEKNQFAAVGNNGQRYPAAYNNTENRIFFVQEGDERALEVKRTFYSEPPGSCNDSQALFRWYKQRKNCNWIANKKMNLCDKKKISLACPDTCGTCERYKCENSALPFYLSKKAKVEWTCEKVANLKKGRRAKLCRKAKFYTTCRETCPNEECL